MSGLVGRFGGVAGSVSFPVNGYSKDVMSSSRDDNTANNVGTLPACTSKLARWIQKKIPHARPGRDPILVKPNGGQHLLMKNGRKKSCFDYTAYKGMVESECGAVAAIARDASEDQSILDEQSKGKSPEWPPRRDRSPADSAIEERGAEAVDGAGLESARGIKDPPAQDGARQPIAEKLRRELPGLDIDRTSPEDHDSIKPDEKEILQTRKRYKEQIGNFKGDIASLEINNGPQKIIEDLQGEIDRCKKRVAILDHILSDKPAPSPISKDKCWSANLRARWQESHPDIDLFHMVRENYHTIDLDALELQFPLLPQERCLLEMELAIEQLFEIHRSDVLTGEQFDQLVEALACGWPGVKEDSRSPLPERRANAAGCIRALAELANKGRLPRDVLSRFGEYDAINRALLIRGQQREMSRKLSELHRAQAALEGWDPGGKGKEREDDVSDRDMAALESRIRELKDDISHFDDKFTPDTDVTKMNAEARAAADARMREAGGDLGAKYAELMQAERSLLAVGVDIRGVRVDEHYVVGLMKKDPKLRKQIALMLARVAFIEEEIARIDRHFERNIPPGSQTRGQVMARIAEQMNEMDVEARERANAALRPNKKLYRAERHYPIRNLTRQWRVDEQNLPVGQLANRRIGDLRKSGEDLLQYAITSEDVLDMKLPSVEAGGKKARERNIATIRNLAGANFMGPADVKLQNAMHGKVRKQIFDTKVGRTALQSATSRTTAQLAGEFLSTAYRWVTGKNDDLSLGHASESVKAAMAKRWRKAMKLSGTQKADIQKTGTVINDHRSTVLRSLAALEKDPANSELRATIEQAHADCGQGIEFIRKMLSNEQYFLVVTMIRAAVLAARPQTSIGEQAKVEPIDTYEASRHRPKIIAILKSWGWSDDDLKLYEVLIDTIVFSRAKDSDKAPGTFTAKRLSRWLESLEPGYANGVAAPIIAGDEPGHVSWKDRAKAAAVGAWNRLVGFVSGMELGPMDPSLLDRFINGAVPAISNFGKISLRTHIMTSAGFSSSTGLGFKVPLSTQGGSQTGIIIKRINDRMEVRLVSGFVTNGSAGVAAGAAVGAVAGGGDAGVNASKWDTHGVTLHFPIKIGEDGKEDFSAVQSYLRTLLKGELPTTEAWAKAASNFEITKKNGWQIKGTSSVELDEGIAVDVPGMGKFSVGASQSAALQGAYRMRHGEQRSGDRRKKITKTTHYGVASASAGAGASWGFEHAAGSNVSEYGGGAVKDKTIVGGSVGAYVIGLANTAHYDLGGDWDWDYIIDIGAVRTAEEALGKCRKDIAAHVKPLLEQQTKLLNGDTVTFRDAIEEMLALMRYNDGFLLQFVPRPEVKAEVGRMLRRIAQIQQQILPGLEPARADNLNPAKRQAIEDQRRKYLDEIADLEAKIRAAKDPDNLDNHQLANVFLLPVVMQTDEMVVLNALGLLKVSHIGVRLHDTLVVQIPAPELRQHDLQATGKALAADQGPADASTSSPDGRPRRAGLLESLKGHRRAIRQRQFENKSSYRSAKVSKVVPKAPRQDMSIPETNAMGEARRFLAYLADPIVDKPSFEEILEPTLYLKSRAPKANSWAQNACDMLDALSQTDREAIKDAVADLDSDQLRRLRVRATLLNARAHKPFEIGHADTWKKVDGDTVRRRKHFLKLIVEACNDGLIAKGHGSEFLGPEKKTAEAEAVGKVAAVLALGEWLVEPSRNLVTALREGRPSDEIQALVKELAPGHKAFGDGLTIRALFDEFIKPPSPPSEVIDKIGRRAIALLEAANGNPELHRTGWLMLKLHNAYYMAREHHIVRNLETKETTAFPNKSNAIPVPKPTEADNAWARSLTRGAGARPLLFRATGTARRPPVDAEASTPSPSPPPSPSSSPRASGIPLEEFTPPTSPAQSPRTDLGDVPPAARERYAVDLLDIPELTRPLLFEDERVSEEDDPSEFVLRTPSGSPATPSSPRSNASPSSDVSLDSFTPRSSPLRPFPFRPVLRWAEERHHTEETVLLGSESSSDS